MVPQVERSALSDCCGHPPSRHDCGGPQEVHPWHGCALYKPYALTNLASVHMFRDKSQHVRSPSLLLTSPNDALRELTHLCRRKPPVRFLHAFE
eukprot:4584327-Pleurochrysis_carterae.AAC.6